MTLFNSLIQYIQKRKYVAKTLVVLVLCGLGVFACVHTAWVNYAAQYTEYSDLAKQTDDAAYLVGSEDNPTRSELNKVLTQVLALPMTPAERLKLSNDGLTLLSALSDQIKAIDKTKDAADTEIAKMQLAALGGLGASDSTKQLLALTKKRSQIVSDIRAYSYRANFETGIIFNRIITDGGKLTPAHVTELNNEVPDLETQFNKRSNLYTELGTVTSSIEETYKADTGILP